jgi:hypothetical protein
MIEGVYWSSCKALLIFVRLQWNLNFFRQIFETYSDIKFHENPFGGIRCGQMDGRTDMTQLIVAFRNFSKAPKMRSFSHTLFSKHNQ